MTAGYIELYIDQGATFNHTIQLSDDLTNDLLNIYGYSVSSQLRRSFYSANASANLICEITDASNGEISMTLPSANTSNLEPGSYVWDVFTVNQLEERQKILEGVIYVNGSVTR